MEMNVQVPAIQSLLATISAVEVGDIYEEGGVGKCKHFTAFGMPDEFTKKVIAYLGGLQAECDSIVRAFRKDEAHRRVDVYYSDSKGESVSGADVIAEKQKEFDAELDGKVRHITFVTNLLYEEVVRQFPQAADKKIDHFFVDKDWTVGWINHTNLHEEVMSSVFGGGAEDEPDLFGHVRAMDPSGRLISLDEALASQPPEVAAAIKERLSSILRGFRPHMRASGPRGGTDFADFRAELTDLLDKIRSRP
jgi:hypothetical protein